MWMSLNKMKVFIAPAFLLFLLLAQRFEMVSGFATFLLLKNGVLRPRISHTHGY